MAQELTHPFSLAFALNMAACSPSVPPGGAGGPGARRGTDSIIDRAGFSALVGLWNDFARLGADCAGRGSRGDCPDASGPCRLSGRGSRIHRPYFLSLLAEAYGKVGQPEEGLTVLVEALALVDNTGERYWEAELHRRKGELLLMQQGQKVGEAEECFRQALDIARRQKAKSLELRAAMSLSRLWQQQGKKREAHQLLADIYGWFTRNVHILYMDKMAQDFSILL